MFELIGQVLKSGGTGGGVVSFVIDGCPAGLGEPVFDKLHADLSKAMLSINAAHGFEYGSGFDGTYLRGSQHNDLFEQTDGRIRTQSNRSGGIQGGISNGEVIYYNVAFKPIDTTMQTKQSSHSLGKAAPEKEKGLNDS